MRNRGLFQGLLQKLEAEDWMPFLIMKKAVHGSVPSAIRNTASPIISKERIWRDLSGCIYQIYLHARIPRAECLEHGKVDHCGIALQRNDEFIPFTMENVPGDNSLSAITAHFFL